MTDNVVQMRDFKRKEEREAVDARLVRSIAMDKLIADSVCELPEVWPDFYHAPDKDPA